MKTIPTFNESSQPNTSLLKEVSRVEVALLQSGGITKKASVAVKPIHDLVAQ